MHELKKQVTILIVTHNMQQAARVSDYTAYMYLGELIEFDITNNIFLKPKTSRRKTTSPDDSDNPMSDKHLSTQFDNELSDVSSRVLEIGGMVEAQLSDAINALLNGSLAAADRAMASGSRVNALEMEIDSKSLPSSPAASRRPATFDC